MKQIISKLQPMGRALMLPIAVLPVAALLLRLGQPDLLNMPAIAAAGDAIFSNLGLLFAIGVAVGLARENHGAAGLAAVVGYLVATHAAKLLQGKHKAVYTPFIDTGDHVVIINAAKVRLTGRKEDEKMYRRHSGYSGGLREERARVVRQRNPRRLMEEAVRGMLPKSRLGDAMFRKVKVYPGDAHPHKAQQPTPFEVA